MKNQQLRLIYTNPREISSEQALLQQLKELAEIGFNEDLKQFIKSNKDNIKLYTSTRFDASKYNKKYLDFIKAMILALSSAENDIDTIIIRKKHSLNQHYARQRQTKSEYVSIKDIQENSTLVENVTTRLHAFREKLVVIRNQQLILQAKSLVKLTHDDFVANQRNLTHIQGDYLSLLSSSKASFESFAEYGQNLDRLFGEKLASTLKEQLAVRKRIMGGILEECTATPAEEAIRREQSELNKLLKNVESIMEQAAELRKLTALLKQIKSIEGLVIKKADELIPSDADQLEKFIQFIADKEHEVQDIKKGIDGNSELHQQSIRAIEQLEHSLQQKKAQALSFLQQIRNKRSEAQQIIIEDSQAHVSVPDLPPIISAPKIEEVPVAKTEEVPAAKKERLQEAISLIRTYRETIENEQDCFTVRFFHQSRNQAKIDYCKLLEKELNLQIASLNFESNLLLIINDAHEKVTNDFSAKKEITIGGSYFGTSRMLSLQRLIGIDDAWQAGHSKFLLFSTQSDFHGLKTSGIVSESKWNVVKKFYCEEDNSNEEYQNLKNQVFPSKTAINLQSDPPSPV